MNAPGLLRAFRLLCAREIHLLLRRKGEMVNPLLFFLIVISLFPLAISPDPKILSLLAPGLLWVAALLSILLSLDVVYRDDFFDGSMEQLLLSGQPPALLVLAKACAHWLLTGLPLLLMSPLLATMLHLPAESLLPLLWSLLLGTPTLCLIGAIGVCLTLGLKKGGVLISLLVLPLYIPVLIFGAGAVTAAAQGFGYNAWLALLAAGLLLALSLAPVAAGAALKVSVSNS